MFKIALNLESLTNRPTFLLVVMGSATAILMATMIVTLLPNSADANAVSFAYVQWNP